MTPPWTGKTVGLALGSGGTKGFAHVGVLRVIEELGIEPEVVTGTSIGSMIGAFWSAGYSASEIEEIVFSDAPAKMRSSGPPALTERSFLDEAKIVAWLKEMLPARIEDLDRRFACVSTDLLSGKRLLHDSGDLTEAIRGSISIPGFFIARETDEHLIVDGGITEPVPVFAAKELGADYIIAITLTVIRDRGLAARREAWSRSDKVRAWNKPGAPGARMQELFGSIDVMAARLSDLALAEADVPIEPRLDQYTVVSAYQSGPDVLAEGERAAREALEPLA